LVEGGERAEVMDTPKQPSIKTQTDEGITTLLSSLAPGIQQRGMQLAQEQQRQAMGMGPTGQPANNMRMAAQGGIIGYQGGGHVQPIPALMEKYGSEMVMGFLEGEKQLKEESNYVAPEYADAYKQKRDNFYSRYPRTFIEELYTVREGPIDISEDLSMAGGGIVGFAGPQGSSVGGEGRHVPSVYDRYTQRHEGNIREEELERRTQEIYLQLPFTGSLHDSERRAEARRLAEEELSFSSDRDVAAELDAYTRSSRELDSAQRQVPSRQVPSVQDRYTQRVAEDALERSTQERANVGQTSRDADAINREIAGARRDPALRVPEDESRGAYDQLLEIERQANIPMMADMGGAPGSQGAASGRRSRPQERVNVGQTLRGILGQTDAKAAALSVPEDEIQPETKQFPIYEQQYTTDFSRETPEERPLSRFQQELLDSRGAYDQLLAAERRKEYAESQQGLEGQRFSPGNRMPPEEVERRREEYRQSRQSAPDETGIASLSEANAINQEIAVDSPPIFRGPETVLGEIGESTGREDQGIASQPDAATAPVPVEGGIASLSDAQRAELLANIKGPEYWSGVAPADPNNIRDSDYRTGEVEYDSGTMRLYGSDADNLGGSLLRRIEANPGEAATALMMAVPAAGFLGSMGLRIATRLVPWVVKHPMLAYFLTGAAAKLPWEKVDVDGALRGMGLGEDYEEVKDTLLTAAIGEDPLTPADETPEELIANGPTQEEKEAIQGRLTLPLPGGGADTDTGFTSPITAVADGATPQEAKVEEAAGIEAFDSDVSGGAAASIATGTVTEVEDPITELVASSGGNTASSGFQAQLDAVIARQNDPMRAITTFLRGMGEGETIGEGMQIAGKALESARRANDAEQIELLKLLEAGRISEQDFELKRLQIQNEKNQIIEYRENSKRVLQAAQSRVAASVSAALMSQYQDVFQDVADREAMSQTLLQQAENEAAREVGGVPRFGGINKLNKDPAFTDLVNKKLTILMETAIAAQLQKASSYAGRP